MQEIYKYMGKFGAILMGIFLISFITAVTDIDEYSVSSGIINGTNGTFVNVTADWFNGNLSCSYITGASYNVCLGDGTGGKVGDGTFLYNDSTTIYFNYTYAQLYLNFSNERITWNSDTDFGGYRLTNIGDLIMAGLITSQNITPITNNLYSLGNSSNWFKEIFVTDIYSKNVNATEINTTDLNSQNINSEDIASDRINTTNATIGGYEVYKDGGGDLNIDLG